MTLFDEIKKGVTKAKADAQKDLSANQVPNVSNQNTTDPRAAWGERQKKFKETIAEQSAVIEDFKKKEAAMEARLSKMESIITKSANQVPYVAPVAVVSAPVEMTHISEYPAKPGAYPAGAKWYAEAFPLGAKTYAKGGITVDSAIRIKLNYPNPADFYAEMDKFVENYGHMSKIFRDLESQKNTVQL